MSATKEHNHDEIEKGQRKASATIPDDYIDIMRNHLGLSTKKCKRHKYSPDGLSYPYVQCTVCGRVKTIWD